MGQEMVFFVAWRRKGKFMVLILYKNQCIKERIKMGRMRLEAKKGSSHQQHWKISKYPNIITEIILIALHAH